MSILLSVKLYLWVILPAFSWWMMMLSFFKMGAWNCLYIFFEEMSVNVSYFFLNWATCFSVLATRIYILIRCMADKEFSQLYGFCVLYKGYS